MKDMLLHIVDVRDVADALLLVYEKPESSGRYISAPNYITTKAMLELLRKARPNYNYVKWWVSYHAFLVCSKWHFLFPERSCFFFIVWTTLFVFCSKTDAEHNSPITPTSSEKLRNLGWKPRKLEETLLDSIEYYQKMGLLLDAGGEGYPWRKYALEAI